MIKAVKQFGVFAGVKSVKFKGFGVLGSVVLNSLLVKTSTIKFDISINECHVSPSSATLATEQLSSGPTPGILRQQTTHQLYSDTVLCLEREDKYAFHISNIL